MTNSRRFTEDDKKRFNGTVEHVEDAQSSNSNAKSKFVDVDEKLVMAEGEEKFTLYIVFVCSTAAVAGFMFGYETGIIGSITVAIGNDLGNEPLSSKNHEVIVAMCTAGAFVSSIFAGALSDKIGRKWVLVISDICYCIGTVIFGAAYSVPQAAVGRLILGFGVGMSSCIGPMYISEISPPQLRGTLVTINSVTICFGQVVSYGLGAALLYVENSGWRIMLVLGAAPALYQSIAIHFLPESPRYLLTRNRTEEAYTALVKMYQKASKEELALKFDVLTANVDESVKIAQQNTAWQLFKSLFTVPKNLRGLSLAMTLQATQQLCGFNGLMYFAPTLFQLLGFENPPSGGLVISAANLVFTALGMSIVDRVGRRPLVAYVSCPGVILGCSWCIVALYYLTKPTGFQLIDDGTVSYDSGKQIAVIMGFVFYVALYGVGLGHVPWTMSDLFSLEVRGIGTGIGTSTNWACNLIISESYLSMQQGITPHGTFALFAGFVCCGWAYLFFCYPETTGLHLEEVQTILSDGFNVRKSVHLRKTKRIALKGLKNTTVVDVEAK